jgi:putative nucleotidyltransferase with HDIG domain
MKKKLEVQELRIGMYVSELDRPWLGTPFLFQGFEIRTEEELAQLRRICRFVYIDTEGPPAAQKQPARPALAIASPATPAESAPRPAGNIPSFEVLAKFSPGQHHKPLYRDEATLEQELPRAREIANKARTLAFTIMDDVRLGRSLPTTEAKAAVADMVESVIRNPDALVCLAQLKKRDEYTVMHSMRVCILALTFGRHLDFTARELNLLGLGALLHDVGKMKIPEHILNKPDRLTPEEFEIIKTHVPHGVAILESHPGIPAESIEVARSHHERYNGAGYIRGLQGDNIGLFGSIGAIVDCYDALTSDRVYHAGVSAYDALGLMYSARRRDFHPELVEQFIQCMGIFPIGCLVELNTGGVGVVVSVNRERRLRPRVALVLTPDKKPYVPSKIVDLMQHGAELEIRKVLPAGTFGINPVDHLPLTA